MSFCPSCGVQRASETDRFCRACGATHVTAAAPQPSPATTPVLPAPPPVVVPAPPPSQSLPSAPPPAVPAQQRRSNLLLLVGVVGLVLAIAIGGLLAWRFLRPQGGASSPEDAADRLFNALAAQDLIAALDVINPAEVTGLDDIYTSLRDRAKDEGLITGDGITDAASVEFSDLTWKVDEVGDGIALVRLTGGHYAATWSPQKLPDRLDFVADEAPADSASGDVADLLDEMSDQGRVRLSLQAIQVDGRWYISLLGTAAEITDAALESEYDDYGEDLRRPDYEAVTHESKPITGATPEDVVQNLVDAVDAGDADEILANLPADLARPLLPYANVAQDLLGPRVAGVDLKVSGLDLKSEDAGDGLLRVTVQGGSATGSYNYGDDSEGGEFDGTVEGRGCVSGHATEYYSDGYSSDDSGSGCLSQVWLLNDWTVTDLGVDEFVVMMRKVGDGYQLDPIATVTAYARTVVDKTPDRFIDEVIVAAGG